MVDFMIPDNSEEPREKIDEEINTIQKSTKTTLGLFSKFHNYLRMKFGWYYRWHLKLYSNQIHIGVAVLSVFLLFLLIGLNQTSHYKLSQAAGLTCSSTADGNWESSSTWTNCSGGVPGTDDSVVISAGQTITITSSNPVNIGSGNIEIDGTLTADDTIASGTITVPTGGTVNTNGNTFSIGGLSLTGGTFNAGASTINNSGNFSITSGTFNKGTSTLVMKGSGSINANGQQLNNLQISAGASDSTISLSGDGKVAGSLITDLNQTLSTGGYTLTMLKDSTTTNNGTISGSGTLELVDTAGGNLTNAGTLSSDVQFTASTSSVAVPATTYGGSVLLFNGTTSNWNATLGTDSSQTITFSKVLMLSTGSSGNLTIAGDTHNPVINISETLMVMASGSGNPTLNGGSGNWTTGSKIQMIFGGSPVINCGSGNWQVGGLLQMTYGTFNAPSGTLALNSSLSIGGGTFTPNASGTMTIGGNYMQSGGTFTSVATTLAVPQTFSLSGGTFNAPTNLTAKNTFTISGGTFNAGSGTVTFTANSTYPITLSGSQVFNNVIFDNETGENTTITLSGSAAISGNLTVQNGSSSNLEYSVIGSSGPIVSVAGNVSMPQVGSQTGSVTFGDSTNNISLVIGGNLSLAYANATLKASTEYSGGGSSSDRLFITDSGNSRMQMFTNTGTYFGKWGSSGSGDGQFNSPDDLAVDRLGNVYIADSGNYRVEKFSVDGKFLGWLGKGTSTTGWHNPGSGETGVSGSGNGEFGRTSGLNIDKDGYLYVASLDNRIQKFNSYGSFVKAWGSSGSSNGQFNHPNYIAFDNSGNLYVTDGANNRVQVFDNQGNFLRTWGSTGTGNGQFKDPEGITIDSSQTVYVADSDNNRIQKFDLNGNYIGQWGSLGSGNYQFYGLESITKDSSDNLYVADYANNRVVKYNSADTYVTQWGTTGSGNGQFNGIIGIGIYNFGSQNQTLTQSAGVISGPMMVNKPSGILNLGSGLTTTYTDSNLNGNLTVQNGTLSPGSNNIVTNGDYSQTGGTFTGSTGTLTLNRTFTFSSGTFTAPSSTLTAKNTFTISGGTFSANSGTINLLAANSYTVNLSSNPTLSNLVFDNDTGSATTLTLGSNISVSGNLTVQNGSSNSYSIIGSSNPTVTVTGNFAAPSSGSGSITFGDAANNFTLKVGGNTTVANANISMKCNTTIAGGNGSSGVDDGYTKQLLHFNGGWGDESGKTWTATATSPTINSSTYKFASGSGYFNNNASSSYNLSTPNTIDSVLRYNDFTISMWVRPGTQDGSSQTLWSRTGNGSYPYHGEFSLNNTFTKLAFTWTDAWGTTYVNYQTSTIPVITDGSFHHLALVRSGGTLYIFVDGTSQTLNKVSGSDFTSETNFTDDISYAGTTYLGYSTASKGFNGYIDEYRFSNGIARWTSNFTKPTAQYSPPATLGSASQSFTHTAGSILGPVVVNKPSGTLTINSLTTTSAGSSHGDFTVMDGTVSLAGDITVGGNILMVGSMSANSYTINAGGSWDSSSGVFSEGTSTINFTGTGVVKTRTDDAWPVNFYNVNMSASSKTTDLQSLVTISNVLTLGTGNLTSCANRCFPALRKNGGTPFVNAGANISSARFTYAPSSGTDVVTGGNYGSAILEIFNQAGSSAVYFNQDGDITTSSTFWVVAHEASTVNYDTQNHALNANAIRIGDPYQSGITATTLGSSTVNIGNGGLYVQNSGSTVNHTMNLGTSTINDAGDWKMVNGTDSVTLSYSTGQNVVLNGSDTQTVTTGIASHSGNKFYNLGITNASSPGVTFADAATVANTFTDTTPASHLTFHAGLTYNFANINMNGTSGNNIVLRSSTSGSAWLFKVTQTSPTVSYIDVKDSNAASGNQINASNHGVDSLGNTNWQFYAKPAAPTNITITPNSSTQATINWTNNESNLNGNKIYISTTANANCALATYPGTQNYTASGSATSQIATSLAVNTQYCVKIIATNPSFSSDPAYSALPKYTLANNPGTPTTSGISSSSVRFIVNPSDSNPSSTTYSILESGQTGKYVQADGSLNDSPVWRTYSQWGGINGTAVTGLSTNIQYTFGITAKNGDAVTTSTVNSSIYTLANIPDAPTVTNTPLNTPTTRLNVLINENSNPANTKYSIYETSTAKYVQADGSLGTSAVYQTFSAWHGSNGIDVIGLSPNTQYTFEVKAQNGDSITTSYSVSGSKFTYIETPSALTFSNVTGTSANIAASNSFTNLTVGSSGLYFTAVTSGHISSCLGSWSKTNSCSDSNLTRGTYSYSVKARNAEGIETAEASADQFFTGFAPDLPSSLGPAEFVDGTWQTNKTPNLTFNLSDQDPDDQVKYQIQISTNSNFSSPVIDYTSTLSNQGSASFMVGQAAGSGAYSVGSEGQELTDGTYYWRVKAIDSNGDQSGWKEAGSTGVLDIKIDTTVPTTDIYLDPATPNGNGGYYKTASPSISFTSYDGSGSGASTVYYRFGTTGQYLAYSSPITAPEGINVIYYYGTDQVGNSGVASPFSRSISVDTAAPTVTAEATPAPNGGNNYYVGITPTITLSADDNSGSGSQSIKYRWGETGQFLDYSSPITTSQEGNNTLYYYAVDNAGNDGSSNPSSSTYYIAAAGSNVAITVSPTDPNGDNGYYINSAPVITLSLIDGSNGAVIKYNWDNTADQLYATSLVAPEGIHTLYYYSIDDSSKRSTETPQQFKTDTAMPVTDIYLNPTEANGSADYYKTTPKITFSVSDSGSGGDSIYYRWGTTGQFTKYSNGINALEGINTIYYYGTDQAGNSQINNLISRTIKVDTIIPTVNSSVDPNTPNGTNDYYITTPAITLTASDINGSGVSNIQYHWNNEPGQTYSTAIQAPEGVNTLYFYSVDNAGQVSEQTSQIFKVNTKIPTVDIYTDPAAPDGINGYFKTIPSITFKVKNSISVNNPVYYRWGSSGDFILYNGEFLAPEGIHTLYYYASNSGGVTEALPISREFKVDTVIPALQINSATHLISGQELLFEGTSSLSAKNITYTWNFNDGTFGTGLSYNHAYQVTGNYPISLKAMTISGNESIALKTIEVVPPAPKISQVSRQSKDLNVTGNSIPEGQISVTMHSDPITITGQSDSKGSWQALLYGVADKLQEGTHTATAIVKDKNGMTSDPSDQVVFVLKYDIQSSVIDTVKDTVQNVAGAIKDAYDAVVTPKVKENTKKTVDIAKPAATVTTVTIGVVQTATAVGFNVFSLSWDFYSLFLSAMEFLGIRRKREPWGVVYDAVTKAPINLAVVRICDKNTDKVAGISVTDTYGRFGFLVEPGDYYMKITCAGYNFFSSLVPEDAEYDDVYSNIYHGRAFALEDKTKVLGFSIPADPQTNEVNKESTFRKIRVWTKKYYLYFLLPSMFLILFSFLWSRNYYDIISLFVLLLLLVKEIYERKKSYRWGIVYDSVTKKPIADAALELIDAASLMVKEEKRTDKSGRYGFIASPGNYLLQVSKEGYIFPSQNVWAKNDHGMSNIYHGEPLQKDFEETFISANIPLDPRQK